MSVGVFGSVRIARKLNNEIWAIPGLLGDRPHKLSSAGAFMRLNIDGMAPKYARNNRNGSGLGLEKAPEAAALRLRAIKNLAQHLQREAEPFCHFNFDQ
jgi:hypothetical protein